VNSVCVACGSSQSSKLCYPDVLRCQVCGLGSRTDKLGEETVQAAYDEYYYTGLEYLDYAQEQLVLQKNFKNRIKYLKRWNTGGKLFEIGAAYGFFLELAQAEWQVSGCDISTPACHYAQDKLGLNIVCSDFTEIERLEDGSYDIICMWDTIEHLYDPDRVIARAVELLKPGGVLCLTTGDFESLSAKLQGRRWRLLHAPTHLYFFGRNSISLLLNRHGLHIVDFEYEGYYRSLGQMAYRLLVANKNNQVGQHLYSLLEKTGILSRDLYLNLYDIMFVIGQKPISSK
jgi:2-polyprenyl-3-methyl-5-hydroxy-6-metoxy-1,4-benzoquinol methylase